MICTRPTTFSTPQSSPSSKHFIPLVVHSLVVRRHGGLLERLCKGRVSVTRPCNILGRSTVLQRQSTLGDHLTGVWSDNVDTKDTVGLGVGQELDHTVGVEVGLCSAVGAEWECAGLVLDALLLEFRLVLAYPGDFGVCVHDGWDGVVVDVTVVLGDEFDGCDGLLLGLVGKHRSECAVTDDADVWDLGAVFLVDDDAAAVVGLKADVLETKTGGVRATTNGDKDNVGVQLKIQSVFHTTRIHVGPLTVSSFPPLAASTLIFTPSAPDSPEVTLVLSLNLRPCLPRVFWMFFEISWSIPGPPI